VFFSDYLAQFLVPKAASFLPVTLPVEWLQSRPHLDQLIPDRLSNQDNRECLAFRNERMSVFMLTCATIFAVTRWHLIL